MPIIRQHDAAPLLKRAVVLDLGDVARQAERIRAAAQEQAQQILQEARDQALRLTENAAAQGRAQGLEAGRQEGLAQGIEIGRKQGLEEARRQVLEQFQPIQQQWTEAMGQWEQLRQGLDGQTTGDLLELALRLAEKLVMRQVELDPEIACRHLASALQHLTGCHDVTVRICPDDRPALEEAMPELIEQFRRLRHIQLAEDPAVSRGGCVVEYDQGRIDATMEMQLNRLVEVILPSEPAGSQPAALSA